MDGMLENRDTFGADLRRLRDAAHLTQVELAAAVGVSARSVQDWEAGTYPRPSQRRRLIALFSESSTSAAEGALA